MQPRLRTMAPPQMAVDLMDRQPFLISFPSSYPSVISYIHSQNVHITIPKNSGGKEEEMKEKNAKSRPIVQIQNHMAQ
jgi:hypothetical protein